MPYRKPPMKVKRTITYSLGELLQIARQHAWEHLDDPPADDANVALYGIEQNGQRRKVTSSVEVIIEWETEREI